MNPKVIVAAIGLATAAVELATAIKQERQPQRHGQHAHQRRH